MVIESNIDYDRWKLEVYRHYQSKFGDKYAKPFIEFVSNRYDKFRKNFIAHKILWRAFDLHNKVLNLNQHQVYGCFGRGGYGKSTVIKNILYFHDPTFNQSRIASTMDGFQEVLCNVLNNKGGGKYKSILIDEPSKETHSSSKEWRMTEDLLGQIRQNNLFIGICATKLDNVKPSLYGMVTQIFAFRTHFYYDFYDEEKSEGVTGLIKKEYNKTRTYECFHDRKVIKKALVKNVYSYRKTPVDEQQKDYDYEKKKAFMDKLRRLHELKKNEETGRPMVDKIDELILKKRKKGQTQQQISNDLEMPRETIRERLKRMKRLGVVVF